MKTLRHHGFNDFVVCLGYKGDVIKEYFANYFLHNCRRHLRPARPGDGGARERGGAVAGHARRHRRRDADRRPAQARRAATSADETFMLTYGDGVADVDITALLAFHEAHGQARHRDRRAAAGPLRRAGPRRATGHACATSRRSRRATGRGSTAGSSSSSPACSTTSPATRRCGSRSRSRASRATGSWPRIGTDGFWQPMDTLRDKRTLEELWERGDARRGRSGDCSAGAYRRPARLRHRPHRLQGVVARALARPAGRRGHRLRARAAHRAQPLRGAGPRSSSCTTSSATSATRTRWPLRSSDAHGRRSCSTSPPSRWCARATPSRAQTFDTNVMGTVNLLEAVRDVRLRRRGRRQSPATSATRNREDGRAVREDDALGGHDPYSASKGCAELVTAAYRGALLRRRRGRGDRHRARRQRHRRRRLGAGPDRPRLRPRARPQAQPIAVRNPDAVRPWQHVLEPLAGYLLARRVPPGGRTRVRGRLELRPRDREKAR